MRVDDIANLIRSVGVKDFEKSRKIIEEIITKESGNVSAQLKHAYSYWGSDNKTFFELPQGLNEFIYQRGVIKSLSSVYLSDEVKSEVDQIFFEHKHRAVFLEEGLPMRNKILLHGKPGNGKTVLAGALSDHFGYKFINVNTSRIFVSKMGESARQVDTLFAQLEKCDDCVLFIDEVDSIANRRAYGEPTEKEKSHTLNNLLTRIDTLSNRILLICATNVYGEIDLAFSRRFDAIIEMKPPEWEEIKKYVADYESNKKVSLNCDLEALRDKNWHEVERQCINAHRAITKDKILGAQENTLFGGGIN